MSPWLSFLRISFLSHTRAILVQEETQTPRGWSFVVTLGDRPTERHDVTLSWVDYEYWSHGVTPPSRIVELVLKALAELRPDAELPPRFDASTLRRLAGGHALDDWMRERV